MAYPPSDWELQRDRRIQQVTGQGNPFVTGVRSWSLQHKNSAEGLRNLPSGTAATDIVNPVVKGNRNSKIYHLPHCLNYFDVSPRNSVPFSNEQQARKAGYRKARNCR